MVAWFAVVFFRGRVVDRAGPAFGDALGSCVVVVLLRGRLVVRGGCALGGALGGCVVWVVFSLWRQVDHH